MQVFNTWALKSFIFAECLFSFIFYCKTTILVTKLALRALYADLHVYVKSKYTSQLMKSS